MFLFWDQRHSVWKTKEWGIMWQWVQYVHVYGGCDAMHMYRMCRMRGCSWADLGRKGGWLDARGGREGGRVRLGKLQGVVSPFGWRDDRQRGKRRQVNRPAGRRRPGDNRQPTADSREANTNSCRNRDLHYRPLHKTELGCGHVRRWQIDANSITNLIRRGNILVVYHCPLFQI